MGGTAFGSDLTTTNAASASDCAAPRIGAGQRSRRTCTRAATNWAATRSREDRKPSAHPGHRKSPPAPMPKAHSAWPQPVRTPLRVLPARPPKAQTLSCYSCCDLLTIDIDARAGGLLEELPSRVSHSHNSNKSKGRPAVPARGSSQLRGLVPDLISMNAIWPPPLDLRRR
jgi:hypothetical protein